MCPASLEGLYLQDHIYIHRLDFLLHLVLEPCPAVFRAYSTTVQGSLLEGLRGTNEMFGFKPGLLWARQVPYHCDPVPAPPHLFEGEC